MGLSLYHCIFLFSVEQEERFKNPRSCLLHFSPLSLQSFTVHYDHWKKVLHFCPGLLKAYYFFVWGTGQNFKSLFFSLQWVENCCESSSSEPNQSNLWTNHSIWFVNLTVTQINHGKELTQKNNLFTKWPQITSAEKMDLHFNNDIVGWTISSQPRHSDEKFSGSITARIKLS